MTSHALTPGLRELLALAADPDFPQVQQQIERLGGCTAPVQLTGYCATLNADTGEALHVFTTHDHPTSRLLVPCGNRRASRCPACSRVYAADTYHLIKAGLSGGKGTPDTVETHPRVFVTLTAPSYGAVHNHDKNSRGTRLTCKCGSRHTPDDPRLGTPVNPRTYDYAGAVLWNAHASALWARFTTYLRRNVACELDLTSVAALNRVLRISFAKVAEYQKRGLIHYHAIIRFDGPEGGAELPPADATTEVLTKAIQAAAKAVTVTLDDDATVGRQVFRFGKRTDVRPLSASPGQLTGRKVAGYVAKYVTKGAEDTGTIDRAVTCPHCKGRGFHTTPTGRADCHQCEGTGEGVPVRHLAVQRHVRQMIRTAWDLGGSPSLAHLNLRKWAHMLGFRGHFSTKSRRYSTTLGALRNTRRTWRTNAAHARILAQLPPTEREHTTTLITESSWQYLGLGYTPGEHLLAEHVRHYKAHTLHLATEGQG
ncbi:replication initiator [Streptomyces sp. NPDC020917]|uniref:replication initiator n=1 Tax=Streptomyces sp. NPDC020917 TaxID=3365102 RepID=UPI00379139A2